MLVSVPLPCSNACALEQDEGSGMNPSVSGPVADIVIKLNRMDPVAFSHSRHLKAEAKKKILVAVGFSCSDCHPALFERSSKGPVGMEVPHERGGCAECHNGKRSTNGMPAAFAATTRCLTCHKPPA
jgi:c(7)-type cytochrome triheme protein